LQKKRIFHQDNAPAHKCFGNGKSKGSAQWIVRTSTLFPRFGSLWPLSLPKTGNSSSLVSVFLRIKRRLQV
jgi:hypothetical protein